MANKNLPSPDVLRQLLAYDPDTGKLAWLERPAHFFPAARDAIAWNAKFSGKTALISLSPKGYRQGRIFNISFLAHRVIYAIHHGEWPSDQIDHINGDKLDNRIDNLRSVSRKENMRNLPMPRSNTSGVMGVGWSKQYKNWEAQIKVDRRRVYLGRFAKFEDAVAARKAAEVEFGYHDNHGRKSA